jgi:hypothetical protein
VHEQAGYLNSIHESTSYFIRRVILEHFKISLVRRCAAAAANADATRALYVCVLFLLLNERAAAPHDFVRALLGYVYHSRARSFSSRAPAFFSCKLKLSKVASP